MTKILSAFKYAGSFTDSRTGQPRQYEKIIMAVSDNGGYPRLVAVDEAVYMEARQKHGDKLLNKDVEFLGTYNYNKYKVTKINVL